MLSLCEVDLVERLAGVDVSWEERRGSWRDRPGDTVAPGEEEIGARARWVWRLGLCRAEDLEEVLCDILNHRCNYSQDKAAWDRCEVESGIALIFEMVGRAPSNHPWELPLLLSNCLPPPDPLLTDFSERDQCQA